MPVPFSARGQVFDVQRFSIHDGPGIRTTVFFKGCPLSCLWCQNPESLSPEPQLALYPEHCLGCGQCVQACPETQAANGRAPRPATCRVCGRCVAVCPAGARRIIGWAASLEELLKLALRDRPFYGGCGGVTLGGGEPLAQWDFARALADRLRAEGVHVALDTACAAGAEIIADVPGHVDLVLADLKLLSPGPHRRWTGADNAEMLEAIRLWSRQMPARLWISLPLVPGVHDEAEIARMAEFAASLPGKPPVRLLPYHRFGDSKYRALGLPAPDFSDAVQELADNAKHILVARGLTVLEGV